MTDDTRNPVPRRSFIAAGATLVAVAAGCSTGDNPKPATTSTSTTSEPPAESTTAGPEPFDNPDPTVEEFFARLTEAINASEDVRLDGPDSLPRVKELADRLETVGWTIDRSDIVVCTHPDGRYFRLVP